MGGGIKRMRALFHKKGKRDNAENNMYILAILIAVELFMSFSFFGYVHIKPLSLTFVYIPVLVAGCMLGPWETTLVGAVFGLASMWKASAFYVGAGDAIFSPSMSGKPLESIMLSVGARTLFGLIVGVLFYFAKRKRHPLPWVIVTASIGRVIHTVLVYGSIQLFFPESGFGLKNVLEDFTRWDFILCTVIADGIVVLCYFFRQSRHFRELFRRIHEIDHTNSMIIPNKKRRIAMLILVILAAFSVAIYFTNRIETVMRQYEITLSGKITYDLLHLQVQFLMGIISLAILVILAIMLYQKNIDYLYYEAKLDGLTGLLGRQQFFHVGEKLLDNYQTQPGLPEKTGCFIIMDIDSFKDINDTYGHPVGDQILSEVAQNFRKAFGDSSIFGRLGGDEFVALILERLSKDEIEQALNQMKRRLRDSMIQEVNVTCSIGVIPIEEDYSLEEMYKHADRLLYEAKKNGKNQFVFGYRYRDMEKG